MAAGEERGKGLTCTHQIVKQNITCAKETIKVHEGHMTVT